MVAILPIGAADGTAGYLTRARRRDAVLTISSDTGGSRRDVPGTDRAGVCVRLRPRGGVIPTDKDMAPGGTAWDASGCIACFVGGAAYFVVGTTVFGAFIGHEIAKT